MSGSTRRAVLTSGVGAAFAGAAASVAYAARPDGPLAASGAGGVAEAEVGRAGGAQVGRAGGAPAGGPSAPVPFRGRHQAGVITPAQDRLHFVALDVITEDPEELRQLLTTWTRAAERMTLGAEAAPGGVVGGGPWEVPQDTGEAFDLPPANLTITIGYGPTLVIADLVRLGFGVVSVRWSQLGFGRTSSTSSAQMTPRNLFGFKDGTANILAEDTEALERHVWVAPEDDPNAAGWLAGGSYLVARRIRMHIEVFGRDKKVGAPLGKHFERDALDFDAVDEAGERRIPLTSHVRLAHESQLGGIRILRRGYNFIDGSDGQGHLDAGLFFLAFMRDPGAQFVPMQRALARADVLNEYIEHTGSAVFACPPGLNAESDWGRQLFG